MPSYQVEMLWDCSSCGTNAIEGTKDHCPKCGAAHDTKKDPWYMPGDTSHRNRIVDRTKLEMAAAGPNWTCEFCGGTQRTLDGICLNCAGPKSQVYADRSSGRPAEDFVLRSRSRPSASAARPVPDFVDDPSQSPQPSNSGGGWRFIGGCVALFVIICGIIGLLFHKRPVEVEVTNVVWTHIVSIERYQQVAQEGFDEDRPGDAKDIDNKGSRFHHHEKMLDHYQTVHYTVRVADGEDCVDVPETCYTTPVSCTPNDNGTADCSGGDEVCSGGGQRCTTHYRDDPRTREEPVYRDEPRYEDYYAWIVWRWLPNRRPTHSGTTTQTTWPESEELCLNCNVGVGQQERESGRQGTYTVHFIDRERADTFDYKPTSEVEFHRFVVGSKHPALYSIAGGLEFQLAAN